MHPPSSPPSISSLGWDRRAFSWSRDTALIAPTLSSLSLHLPCPLQLWAAEASSLRDSKASQEVLLGFPPPPHTRYLVTGTSLVAPPSKATLLSLGERTVWRVEPTPALLIQWGRTERKAAPATPPAQGASKTWSPRLPLASSTPSPAEVSPP